MILFDTHVQKLKYKVIRELIKSYDNKKIDDAFIDIPKIISPGPKAELRCCIYKERAIIQERLKLAMNKGETDNVIEVIDIACDECPVDGVSVTPSCRGCLSHRCKETCPTGAISIIDKKCTIDKSKCVECGKCIAACPYNAIIKQNRPCVVSCKTKAISVDENKKAVIDQSKCISCGACVYQCPFGAISDKSLILEVLDILNNSNNNTNYNVYAVIAPSIVSQFRYAKIEQVITGIKKLGFHHVVEAALGADITLYKEAHELKEKGILTTSCCPSFVMFVEKFFPELVKYISDSPSPMIETALLIKKADKNSKVVFIGPCSSKKLEYKLAKTKGAIDSVLSFEELQAFFDARNIDVSSLGESSLNNASYYGRIFAKSGGISEGVKNMCEKDGVSVNVATMNGIADCRTALTKLKFGKAVENFFEGMACEGGCINGALCLNHGSKNISDVDKYGKSAHEKNIDNSVKLYNLYENDFVCEHKDYDLKEEK